MITKTVIALILFVFCLAPATAIRGQNPPAAITGEWRIEFTRNDPNEVQLTMILGSRSKKQNWGSGVPISEIQGLSREQAVNSTGPVTLRIAREAGTFEMVGSFRDGKGSGRFTLTPNQSFFSALAARGYSNLTDSNVFSAAMANLKISSIDELKSAGYDRLTFDNLIESSLFHITAASISDLKSAGFNDLPFEKLVEAGIFKVDSAFAQQAEGLGFGRLPLEKLVELRIHKISPEYISEISRLGFSDLNLDRLIEFKIFKVTPQFVNDLRAAGFASITPQELVNLRVFGIDIDYVRRARAQNPNITIQDLVDQRIHEKSSQNRDR